MKFMKCLVDEDPKVRKNAAAILGELHCQDALDVLMDAYEEEDKLFVREAYVQALSAIDCSEYLPQLEERLQELAEYDAPEEEKKHSPGRTACIAGTDSSEKRREKTYV